MWEHDENEKLRKCDQDENLRRKLEKTERHLAKSLKIAGKRRDRNIGCCLWVKKKKTNNFLSRLGGYLPWRSLFPFSDFFLKKFFDFLFL